MKPRRAHRLSAAVVLAASLAGCSHETVRSDRAPVNHGDASWQAVDQPDTAHYTLALGEVSSGATAFRRVTPIYPAGPLSRCPAQVEITVQLVVDTNGQVTSVRPANPASAGSALTPYLEATRAAAMQWEFNPLQIDHWSANAEGETHVVDSRTLPFSLDYVFRFTCHAGRRGVSAGDAVAPEAGG